MKTKRVFNKSISVILSLIIALSMFVGLNITVNAAVTSKTMTLTLSGKQTTVTVYDLGSDNNVTDGRFYYNKKYKDPKSNLTYYYSYGSYRSFNRQAFLYSPGVFLSNIPKMPQNLITKLNDEKIYAVPGAGTFYSTIFTGDHLEKETIGAAYCTIASEGFNTRKSTTEKYLQTRIVVFKILSNLDMSCKETVGSFKVLGNYSSTYEADNKTADDFDYDYYICGFNSSNRYQPIIKSTLNNCTNLQKNIFARSETDISGKNSVVKNTPDLGKQTQYGFKDMVNTAITILMGGGKTYIVKTAANVTIDALKCIFMTNSSDVVPITYKSDAHSVGNMSASDNLQEVYSFLTPDVHVNTRYQNMNSQYCYDTSKNDDACMKMKIKNVTNGADYISIAYNYRFSVVFKNYLRNSFDVVNVNVNHSIQASDAPVIKSFANEKDGITIKWSRIQGVPKYTVYRKENGLIKVVGTTTGSSLLDKTGGFKSGYNYSYFVCCCDSYVGRISENSSTKTALRLDAPTLNLSKTTSGFKLSWNKINGASKYNVYVIKNGCYSLIKTTTGTSITYPYKGSYTFAIESVSSSGVKSGMYFKAL